VGNERIEIKEETMTFRRSMNFAVVAAAAAIIAALAGTATANAASSSGNVGITNASHATSGAVASCNSSNAWVGVVGTNYDFWICGVATANTAGHGPFYELDINVKNRVWFHQNSNGSGWADCFSGQYTSRPLTGRDKNPGNVQVTSNTSAC
jgi:hypothetical protein